MTKHEYTKQILAQLKAKGLLNEKAVEKFIAKKKLNEGRRANPTMIGFPSHDDYETLYIGPLKDMVDYEYKEQVDLNKKYVFAAWNNEEVEVMSTDDLEDLKGDVMLAFGDDDENSFAEDSFGLSDEEFIRRTIEACNDSSPDGDSAHGMVFFIDKKLVAGEKEYAMD